MDLLNSRSFSDLAWMSLMLAVPAPRHASVDTIGQRMSHQGLMMSLTEALYEGRQVMFGDGVLTGLQSQPRDYGLP